MHSSDFSKWYFKTLVVGYIDVFDIVTDNATRCDVVKIDVWTHH